MLCYSSPLSFLLLLATTTTVADAAFNFPSIPNVFGKPSSTTASDVGSTVQKTKAALLKAISGTKNGKDATPQQQRTVLGIVAALEENQVVPIELSNPQDLQKLDGTWYLQYTSPSSIKGEEEESFEPTWKPEFAKEGDSNIETKPFQSKGTISAAGIAVDTSAGLTKQTFDVEKLLVINNITTPTTQVVVSGPFRPSPNVPNRGIVSFDTADIGLFNNKIVVSLGWIFDILAKVNGSKDNGWLETTYLDDELRIGRGNKGTMFVLTRDANAVPS